MLFYQSYALNKYQFFITYSTEFIKKNQIRFAPNKCSEDNIFTIKAVMLAKGILYIQKSFYNYRIRSDSCSHKISNENFCIFDNIKLLRDFLIEKNWFDKYKKEYYNYAIYILHWHYMLISQKQHRKYLKESRKVLTSKNYKKFLKEINQVTCLEKVFSVRNIGIYKQIYILGFKFKIKTKELIERERFKQIIDNQKTVNRLLRKILEVQSNLADKNEDSILHSTTTKR